MKLLTDEQIDAARRLVARHTTHPDCTCGAWNTARECSFNCPTKAVPVAALRLRNDHDNVRAQNLRLKVALMEIRSRADRSDTGIAHEISTTVDAVLEER